MRGLGRIALAQLVDRKAGAIERAGDRAVEMAASGKPLPHGLDPLLPAPHIGVRGAAMFEEQHLPAGAQDAAQFAHHLRRFIDRTQGEGAHHAVEAGIAERDRLAAPLPEVGRPALVACRRAGGIEQTLVRVDPGIGGDRAGVVEFVVDPAAAAQFEHVAARQRHHRAAALHHLTLRTGAGDQLRHDVRFVPALEAHMAVPSPATLRQL